MPRKVQVRTASLPHLMERCTTRRWREVISPGVRPVSVSADSKGKIWVSEWNVGQLGRYDPATDTWKEWRMPGKNPGAYAVYVDDQDKVWVSDFGANAFVRFDPITERFE